MGCGSSSLKGDAPSGVGDESNQPIKKVQTNFASVDYETSPKNRRMTEFAPDQTTPRPHSTASEGTAPDSAGAQADSKLEPYHTLEDSNNVPSGSGGHAVNGDTDGLGGVNPVSDSALQDFASENDPANPVNQKSHHTNTGHMTASDADKTALDEKEHKKSFMERFSDKKLGRDKAPPTDEELEKYTGMTREEFDKWKQDPNSGTGENASASPLAAHGVAGSGPTYIS